MTTQLWRTPSGRLHRMRRCSGGARHDNTTSVTLTDAELRDVPMTSLCRCAWHSREKAAQRQKDNP